MTADESPEADPSVPQIKEEVELLLFEVGGQRYGVDASQVVRIGRSGPDAFALPPLGALTQGKRSLIFRSDAGERELKVDAVQKVQTVPLDTLRRMPTTAGARPYTIGVWLDGQVLVLLIDLASTSQETVAG